MDLIYFRFQFPGLDKIGCIFTGRKIKGAQGSTGNTEIEGNISFAIKGAEEATLENRRQLADFLRPLGVEYMCECHQVHGSKILVEPQGMVFTDHMAPLRDADGMMTSKTGIGLMIKTADCQPLLLAEAKGQAIMALHIGWRGNRALFIQEAVELFCARYGFSAKNTYAVRGPSLGSGFAQFTDFDNEWGPAFNEWFNRDAQTMDLWGLTRKQLMDAGVPPVNIFGLDICTAMNNTHFFSYRRHKDTGRQAGIIWIRKEERV